MLPDLTLAGDDGWETVSGMTTRDLTQLLRHRVKQWLSASDESEKRTVRARRRRRTTTTSGERERAEAPKRERSDSGSKPPSRPPSGGSSGGRPPGPGGSMSPKMMLVVAGIVILIFIFGGPSLLSGLFNASDGAVPADNVVQQEPAAPALVSESNENTSEVAPQSTSEPVVPGTGDTWTVLLYQDADDKVLEKDIYIDLNEAERIGSSDNVRIVAQVDRYRDGYSGDGNWSSTKRFHVMQDDDLNRLGSDEVQDLGEVNMSDGDTLVDFVVWGIENYPADKYALILSDHGMGWPGGWSDPDPQGRGDPNIPLAQAMGDQLYLNEMDQALGEIRERTGIDKLDLVGLDACLMSHMEVYSALAPHAKVAVASQETEPALGWAYTGFLEELVRDPNMDAAEVAAHIVDTYIGEDQRIIDEQARAEFLGAGRGLFNGLMPAAQLTERLEENITLTAIDLTAMPELTQAVNDFAYSLSQVNQKPVAKARTYAQSFTSIFGKQVPPSYIDLGNFAQHAAQQSQNSELSAAGQGVLDALGLALIAEKHGPNKPGATGVSLYFPNSALYGSPQAGPPSYTKVADRFAAESLWDDFLAYHYTGRSFEPTSNAVVVPDRSASVEAPGGGEITLSPVQQSADSVALSDTVLFSSDVSGESVGHVKFFVGYWDQAGNAIYVADTDFLESGETREVGGVYYPDWGEGDFTIEFEWEPFLFAIDDGVTKAMALFQPQDFGASPELAIYGVDGIYTYADGEERVAQLQFVDGEMRQVFGFANEDGTGAPREIIPQAGDTFTLIERWMDLDGSGRVTDNAFESGDTLTFGETPFTQTELDAAAGAYVVGFIAEDLDGNETESYALVTVE